MRFKLIKSIFCNSLADTRLFEIPAGTILEVEEMKEVPETHEHKEAKDSFIICSHCFPRGHGPYVCGCPKHQAYPITKTEVKEAYTPCPIGCEHSKSLKTGHWEGRLYTRFINSLTANQLDSVKAFIKELLNE